MKLKPFASIPGPKALPLIGSLYNYLPLFGEYSFNRLHYAGLLKYQRYGPLVRERLFGNVNLLHVFDPPDIKDVFASDGQFPFRRSHIALEKYRCDRPHMYSGGGLIPTNGEEWWHLRREAQKVLSRLGCVRAHLPTINEIACDFVSLIHSSVNPKTNEISSFLPFLKRAYLEMTLAMNLDVRIGALDVNIPEDGEVSQLLWASHASLRGIIATDNGIPFWKMFNTPFYKELVQGQDIVYRIALKYVTTKEKELTMASGSSGRNNASAPDVATGNGKEALTTLEFSIMKTNLTKKEIMTVICDAILGGIDTTSYTTAFILYHLAKNPEKQEILAREVEALLGTKGGEVTSETLNEAKYVKAVFKEGLRLNPVAVGIGRIAKRDFPLRGYLIPEGTILITQNQVSCGLENYFVDAKKFLPERWLEKKTGQDITFLHLPFGYGPRSCIGRRTAEQNVYTLLLQLLKEFRIEWTGGAHLDCYTHLLNEPDSPLTLKFITRH